MATPDHLLPSHVYVTMTDAGAIFLDLRSDVYAGIDRAQSRALHGVVKGWPATAAPEPEPGMEPTRDDVQRLVTGLVSRGLLTADLRAGKPATLAALTLAEDTFLFPPHSIDYRIGLLDCVRMLRAWAGAVLWLRKTSLARAIAQVQGRKARAAASTSARSSRELVWKFRRLRLFLYSPHDQCLFDSLVLMRFLAQYAVFPTWVIGVRGSPFEAHAWVQQDATVLNDTPEYVLRFNPILTA